jgi:hypothetical protein
MAYNVAGAIDNYYQNRLVDLTARLKAEHGLENVSFYPSANAIEATEEDVARDACSLLDDFLSGSCTDITDKVK